MSSPFPLPSSSSSSSLSLRWCFGFENTSPSLVHSLSTIHFPSSSSPSSSSPPPPPSLRHSLCYPLSSVLLISDLHYSTQHQLHGHHHPISAVSVSSDRRWIVSGDEKRREGVGWSVQMMVWDSIKGEKVEGVEMGVIYERENIEIPNTSSTNDVNNNKNIIPSPLSPSPFHVIGIQSLEFSPDTKFIFSILNVRDQRGERRQMLRVWQWAYDNSGNRGMRVVASKVIEKDNKSKSKSKKDHNNDNDNDHDDTNDTKSILTDFHHIAVNPSNPFEFMITSAKKVLFVKMDINAQNINKIHNTQNHSHNSDHHDLSPPLPFLFTLLSPQPSPSSLPLHSHLKSFLTSAYLPLSSMAITGTSSGYAIVWDIKGSSSSSPSTTHNNNNNNNNNHITPTPLKILRLLSSPLTSLTSILPHYVLAAGGGVIKVYDYSFRMVGWIEGEEERGREREEEERKLRNIGVTNRAKMNGKSEWNKGRIKSEKDKENKSSTLLGTGMSGIHYPNHSILSLSFAGYGVINHSIHMEHYDKYRKGSSSLYSLQSTSLSSYDHYVSSDVSDFILPDMVVSTSNNEIIEYTMRDFNQHEIVPSPSLSLQSSSSNMNKNNKDSKDNSKDTKAPSPHANIIVQGFPSPLLSVLSHPIFPIFIVMMRDGIQLYDIDEREMIGYIPITHDKNQNNNNNNTSLSPYPSLSSLLSPSSPVLSSPLSSVSFSPDGSLLAVAFADGQISLYNFDNIKMNLLLEVVGMEDEDNEENNSDNERRKEGLYIKSHPSLLLTLLSSLPIPSTVSPPYHHISFSPHSDFIAFGDSKHNIIVMGRDNNNNNNDNEGEWKMLGKRRSHQKDIVSLIFEQKGGEGERRGKAILYSIGKDKIMHEYRVSHENILDNENTEDNDNANDHFPIIRSTVIEQRYTPVQALIIPNYVFDLHGDEYWNEFLREIKQYYTDNNIRNTSSTDIALVDNHRTNPTPTLFPYGHSTLLLLNTANQCTLWRDFLLADRVTIVKKCIGTYNVGGGGGGDGQGEEGRVKWMMNIPFMFTTQKTPSPSTNPLTVRDISSLTVLPSPHFLWCNDNDQIGMIEAAPLDGNPKKRMAIMSPIGMENKDNKKENHTEDNEENDTMSTISHSMALSCDGKYLILSSSSSIALIEIDSIAFHHKITQSIQNDTVQSIQNDKNTDDNGTPLPSSSPSPSLLPYITHYVPNGYRGVDYASLVNTFYYCQIKDTLTSPTERRIKGVISLLGNENNEDDEDNDSPSPLYLFFSTHHFYPTQWEMDHINMEIRYGNWIKRWKRRERERRDKGKVKINGNHKDKGFWLSYLSLPLLHLSSLLPPLSPSILSSSPPLSSASFAQCVKVLWNHRGAADGITMGEFERGWERMRGEKKENENGSEESSGEDKGKSKGVVEVRYLLDLLQRGGERMGRREIIRIINKLLLELDGNQSQTNDHNHENDGDDSEYEYFVNRLEKIFPHGVSAEHFVTLVLGLEQ